MVEASYLGFRTEAGRRAQATFLQIDPVDPLTVGIVENTAGRLPGPSETLLSAGLADRLELAVGDRFVVDTFGLDAELPVVVGLGAWLASTVAHGVRPVRMSTLAED